MINFFLEIKESIIISLNAIRANKMRSILATLGIVIGIMAVTILQTAIEGINRAFEKSISAVGADVLYVQNLSGLEEKISVFTATGVILIYSITNI